MLRAHKKIIEKYERGIWFPFRGGKLKIRPVHIWQVPGQKAAIVAADSQAVQDLMTQETMKRVFMLALVGWKNVWDRDGKRLKMTEAVKNAIFDNDLGGVREFVLKKSIGLLLEILFELGRKNG